MSNPAYLWLTDENGSPMVGPSLVSGREGAIELKSFTHNVNIPIDGNTGKLTGTRIHMPIMFQKEFDRVTLPGVKYRENFAICDVQTVSDY